MPKTKTKGETKVLPLPTENTFIDAQTALERFFADYRVKGKAPTIRWVREYLKPVEVRHGPRRSGYWTADIRNFLKGRAPEGGE